MVQTTKGPANSKTKRASPAQQDQPEKTMKDLVHVDEETWGRVMQQAASQQSTPEDVVARTLELAFGKGQPTAAQDSGVTPPASS